MYHLYNTPYARQYGTSYLLTCTHFSPLSPSTFSTNSDLLEFLFIKHSLFIEDLTQYNITATRDGSPIPVDLDIPSKQYASCTVEVKPLCWKEDKVSHHWERAMDDAELMRKPLMIPITIHKFTDTMCNLECLAVLIVA